MIRITLALFSNKQFLNLLIKVDFLRHFLAQVNVLKRLQAETDVVQGMKGSTNVEFLRLTDNTRASLFQITLGLFTAHAHMRKI